MQRIRPLAGVLTLVACAAPTAAPTPEAKPFDFDALLARDLAVLPAARELRGPEGLFVAQVPAATDPTVEMAESTATIAWSIGTEQPVVCIAYRERVNVAEVLRRMFDSIRAEMTKTGLERIDAGELGGQPYLALDAVYRLESPNGPAGGEIKLIAVAHQALSLVCTHDEPGYRKAFRDVVAALAKSFSLKGDAPPSPTYRAIHAFSVGELNIGFNDVIMSPGDGDKRVYYSSAAMLAPKPDGSLGALDVDTYEVCTKNGILVEGRFSTADSGEQKVDVELALKDRKTYALTGTVEGKEVAVEIPAQTGVVGEYGQLVLAADGLAKKSSEWKAIALDPRDASGTRTVSYAMTAVKDGDWPVVAVDDGKRRSRVALDPHGYPAVMTVLDANGQPMVVMRRVAITHDTR